MILRRGVLWDSSAILALLDADDADHKRAAAIVRQIASERLPGRLALVSRQHRRYDEDAWAVYTPRHMPEDTVPGHLTFALRYEGVDLAGVRALFQRIGGDAVEAWVRREPVSRGSRLR